MLKQIGGARECISTSNRLKLQNTSALCRGFFAYVACAAMNDAQQSVEAISKQSHPDQRTHQLSISKIMLGTAIVAGGLTITTVSFDLPRE